MATQSYSTDLGLGILPETKDPKIFPDMLRIINAIRILQAKLDIYTGNVPVSQLSFTQSSPDRVQATCSVAISVGSLVNFSGSTTTLSAQLADSGLLLPAQGIAVSNYAAGTQGVFILAGQCPHFLGLSIGQIYYLGAAGTLQLTPTAYPVGLALSTTTLWMKP